MKKIILFAFFLISGSVLMFAQNAPSGNDPARETTDQLVKLYNLDARQAQQMYQIQQNKFKNLAEIEPLKTSNPDLYAQKHSNVFIGADASIRQMLKAEQMPVFQQQMMEKRKKRADKLSQLKKEGASNEEIKKAMATETY